MGELTEPYQREPGAQAREHATPYMNGKPQVMVVDDDLAMCNFLRSFLAERG